MSECLGDLLEHSISVYLHFISVKYQFSIFTGWFSGYFELNKTHRRLRNCQNAKYPRLTSLGYVNVIQMSVNKQRYWMALMLVYPNGAYVGIA